MKNQSVTLVHVQVVPGQEEAFVSQTLENQRLSRQEPGCLRFDVLQDPEDATRFILYEVFESQDGAKAHKETDHYLKWREAVATMMAQPRRGEPWIFYES